MRNDEKNHYLILADEAKGPRVFSVPVEELSREEQFGVVGILKGMEAMIKARLKAIEPALRGEAAAAPLSEDGSQRRVAIDDLAEVVEYQPKVERVLDADKVREVLEAAGIDPEIVLTPVVSYSINEAKLEALVELGQVGEEAVEAAKVEKKGRKSVHIRAIGALKAYIEGKRSTLLEG